ncbi:hypothetical protein P175DRAFT_0433542 [Aspergillus ochraceoroseus IBT 24754]|uniref:Ion transport domain-containing protein n=1 Tax=Aspergillus ochraceoroseus IBT 24754 TaxID=1392256 RepID=A0A2T5M3U3_9EURO|nr:uncharacterized protein P175DRAFT_0433542 [Aspergillus ochraceoroseus IBT 24754]PTU23199.1 hypothetical protein P175DRAFT_0433542 [Aspergillus ochraceoroseus IBT 24754]
MGRDLAGSFIASADHEYVEAPVIGDEESLVDVVRKLDNFITLLISEASYTFEDMRSSPDHGIRLLINSLAENSRNPCIISALMILKWKFEKAWGHDRGQNETRGFACEYIAWKFLCHLHKREMIQYLLEELTRPLPDEVGLNRPESGISGLTFSTGDHRAQESERTPLLPNSGASQSRFFASGRRQASSLESGSQDFSNFFGSADEAEQFSMFFGLNALEIATIAQAKKFLSQRVVQRVIDDLWTGEIVFWDSLSVHSIKKPQLFNKRTADPYSRLRVPAYRKAFEAAFFVSFLLLYYAVLVERKPTGIGVFEALMYIWIAAFAYDEISGVVDSGMLFYQMTFWNLWDLFIIGTGAAFVVTSEHLNPCESASSVLIFSLVSLNPYFGSLTKAFFRFMPVIIVLYLGFLTTFTMLSRDRLSSQQMSWILVKIFFGYGGQNLLLLLISSLVSLMSMSLEGVMSHAREEYLFQLAIYVLESSNSRRLTYFLPPLNLIPLLCIRPMRLFLPAENIRRVRIILLRATHLPLVALLWAYESSRRFALRRNSQSPPTIAAREFSRPTSSTRARFVLSTHPAPSQTSAADAQSLAPGGHVGYNPSVQRPGTRESEAGPSRPNDIAEMIAEMERLRAQVERVAAVVGVHQRNRR